MTTDLATTQQLPGHLELTERDREAAQAVAAGLRDAQAGNTRRACSSAWQQFRMWAEAGGHRALPAAPQAVALYLGHLASTGRSIATVQQAHSAISHFHAAAGMHKGDSPSRHPVVAEAVKGWRNRALAPRQAGALTADALARVREVLRLPKRGRGGRMESADNECHLSQPEQVLGMVRPLGGALGGHLPVLPEEAGQLQFLQVVFQ